MKGQAYNVTAIVLNNSSTHKVPRSWGYKGTFPEPHTQNVAWVTEPQVSPLLGIRWSLPGLIKCPDMPETPVTCYCVVSILTSQMHCYCIESLKWGIHGQRT